MSGAVLLLCFGVPVLLYAIVKLCAWLIRKPFVSGIHNKYILITGCSSGFGYDAVKRLDALGCHVFAGVRDEGAAEKIRATCSSRVIPVYIDVAKPESVEQCYKEICGLLPVGRGLWGLVNNAGVSSDVRGPVDWHTTQTYRDTLDVNTFGLIDTTLRFLPLIKHARGRIVNVTSALGAIYAPCYSAYTMSKHAAEAFTDTLRCEMHCFGIGVSIIEPGSYFTMINDAERAANRAKHNIDSLSSEIKQQYGQEYIDKIQTPSVHSSALGTTDLAPVIDTYVHALLAVYPRARYVVGKGMATVILLHRMLPVCVYDFLARKNAPTPAVRCG